MPKIKSYIDGYNVLGTFIKPLFISFEILVWLYSVRRQFIGNEKTSRVKGDRGRILGLWVKEEYKVGHLSVCVAQYNRPPQTETLENLSSP